jgi:preprotein translocase subunit SecA
VDRQLFGRSARQGDPGSAQAFVSLEDELLQRYLPKTVRKTLNWAWRSGMPGKDRLARAAWALAQGKAQSLAFQQRRHVLRSDVMLDEALSFAGVETI